ncbi:hypothetical protein J3R82DRAFT_4853 [Butyriboletus roseoflavus]|nr:hypothetical protein J3R82DRAFT_4853 [Butyriboletus roseoflavus]
MYFNTHTLLFPALFVTSGVLAQLSAVATGYTPDVTYPGPINGHVDSFVFCSAQDCSGTCEIESTAYIAADDGHDAPNDMGYLSIYWYDPGSYAWDLYTCISPTECTADVQIGPNTCYNLYDNGIPTYFYDYFYFLQNCMDFTSSVSLP